MSEFHRSKYDIMNLIDQLDYEIRNNGKMSNYANMPSDVIARMSDLRHKLDTCVHLLSLVDGVYSDDITNEMFCAEYDKFLMGQV